MFIIYHLLLLLLLLGCLVAWLREFCRTLEIIARTVREVVNRVRLCGHHTRGYSRGEVHVYGEVMLRWGYLVAWLREFRRTVEIVARPLREVVTRVRLCCHRTPFESFAQ